ncbi:MAG: heparinase II/III family protein, partial [Anaerolineae bacterium]
RQMAAAESAAFLLPPAATGEYAAALVAHYRDNTSATIDAAERLCRHELSLLGRDLHFSGAMRWHLDPDSGWEWPRQYVGKLDQWVWRDDAPADLKLPWELSRHQYLVTLAKAAWITGEDRYADECADIILDWVRQNPTGIGINWYSALEIGVRLISWCLAFQFLRGSKRFRERAGEILLKSVYQQTEFLRGHLTTDHAVRNNHAIGETAALAVVASHFPQMRGADSWLATGLRLLTAELAGQTHADGMNKEQAPAYHRFVLDFALLVVALARRGAIPPVPDVEALVERMLEYALAVTTPAGEIAAIGDADDGRGYLLDERNGGDGFREALSMGAVLFSRPDCRWAAGTFSEAAFWLLGPEARRQFEAIPAQPPADPSAAFVPGGQYAIRDHWGRDADHALFRCGPFGWGGEGHCAHAHCDLLGFTLVVGGEPLLVDSGTYTYHGEWRSPFRLTAAHNTVRVDGFDQARPGNAFSWEGVPEARCLEWTGERVVGTMTLAGGVTHTRALERQAAASWLVEDSFEGPGGHRIEWFFHCAPGCRLEVGGDGGILIHRRHDTIRCQADAGVRLRAGDGWASPSYGRREHTDVLIGEWQGTLSPRVVFRWRFHRERQ